MFVVLLRVSTGSSRHASHHCHQHVCSVVCVSTGNSRDASHHRHQHVCRTKNLCSANCWCRKPSYWHLCQVWRHCELILNLCWCWLMMILVTCAMLTQVLPSQCPAFISTLCSWLHGRTAVCNDLLCASVIYTALQQRYHFTPASNFTKCWRIFMAALCNKGRPLYFCPMVSFIYLSIYLSFFLA